MARLIRRLGDRTTMAKSLTGALDEVSHKWRRLAERRQAHLSRAVSQRSLETLLHGRAIPPVHARGNSPDGTLDRDSSARRGSGSQGLVLLRPTRSRRMPLRRLPFGATRLSRRGAKAACRVAAPFFMLGLPPPPTQSCDMSSALFSPTRLAGLELANRIVVSPMCQYSADDGVASDWHLNHLGMLANSGAALVVVEATGVERRGRITHGCLGIYSDDCEAALARVVAHCRRYGTAKLGIQIGHAGRKASASRPWEGSRSLAAGRRCLGDHRAVGDPVRPQLACPTRDDGCGHGAGTRGLRRGCAPRRPRRYRRDRTAWRPRLSPAQLCLADLEQADRRLRRHARRAHALSARSRQGGARGGAGSAAAGCTHHRRRLDRRRIDAGRCGDICEGAQGRGARFRLHLVGRRQHRFAPRSDRRPSTFRLPKR